MCRKSKRFYLRLKLAADIQNHKEVDLEIEMKLQQGGVKAAHVLSCPFTTLCFLSHCNPQIYLWLRKRPKSEASNARGPEESLGKHHHAHT